MWSAVTGIWAAAPPHADHRPTPVRIWRWTFAIGQSPAQAYTWDALHACDRHTIVWGHIKLDGSFTFGGLEYEVPVFQECMRARGFRFAP